MTQRMRGEDRRRQVLDIAAREFAERGLYGASTEAIAREAGITQAYVFRMFGTKKALFLELVTAAFDRVSDGMLRAGAGSAGPESLTPMGAQYYDLLADRISLLLQLQGLAGCGDAEVRAAVRTRFARMWQVVEDTSGLDAVTVKSFLAFGMLLNVGAALGVDEVAETDQPTDTGQPDKTGQPDETGQPSKTDQPDETERWVAGIRTRIRPGLFDHITDETNR